MREEAYAGGLLAKAKRERSAFNIDENKWKASENIKKIDLNPRQKTIRCTQIGVRETIHSFAYDKSSTMYLLSLLIWNCPLPAHSSCSHLCTRASVIQIPFQYTKAAENQSHDEWTIYRDLFSARLFFWWVHRSSRRQHSQLASLGHDATEHQARRSGAIHLWSCWSAPKERRVPARMTDWKEPEQEPDHISPAPNECTRA